MTLTLNDALHEANIEWDTHKDGMKTYYRALDVISLIALKPSIWNTEDVTEGHLRGAATALAGPPRNLGPATVNRYIAAFRGMYRINGLIPPGFRTRREPPGRQHIPSEEMITAMIERLEEKETRADRGVFNEIATAVLILKETGLRVGELLALTQEDVDVETNWLTLTDTKDGKGRRVPVSRYIAMLAHEYVPFTVSYSRFSRKWAQARVALGYPDWLVLHTLRHFRASRLVAAGVPIPVVSTLLGHATWQTTMRYTHIDPAALRLAVDGVSGGGSTGLPSQLAQHRGERQS